VSDVVVQSAVFSDAGRRPNNDDCVLVEPEHGIYVVCDGAGGKMGGRRAAELICETVRQRGAEISASRASGVDAAQKLVQTVLFEAHNQIIEQQRANPTHSSMTSTVAMAVIDGRQAMVSHVGDSRVNLYRPPDLWQITRDHNLENYLKDNPHLKPKLKRPGKTLLQALGLDTSHLTIDQSDFELQTDDVLLISSDGLTDAVPAWAIREVLEGGHDRVEGVVEALGRAAIRHGSMDNISAIVLHVDDRPRMDAPRTAVFDLSAVSAASGPILGWLTFLEGDLQGDVIQLESTIVIGADPHCRIHLDDGYVSSRHVEVFRDEKRGFVLRDLNSTNGTHVNNAKVDRGAEVNLVDGDIIKIGTTEVVFKCYRIQA
jgi:serine/threonine protein phosphatase PrpC